MHDATVGRSVMGLLAVAALLALTGVRARQAAAGKEEAKHLIFRTTYAAALEEGRVRNVPVFVSRHKDFCGRCKRQYAKVLSNKAFIKWANRDLVVLIAHNELGHDAVELEGVTGRDNEVCPLYPPMTCREHLHAAVDIDNAREEGMIKIPFVELCPNSWLVTPMGEVERILEKDQFDAGKVRAQVEAMQKKAGKTLSRETYLEIAPLLDAAREAVDEDEWHAALEALAGVARLAPDPAEALRKLIEARLVELNEYVAFVAEDVLDAAIPTETERKQARDLLTATDVAVYDSYLPVRETLKAWLAEAARR